MRNMRVVREFMSIAYSPQKCSADAVMHLCVDGGSAATGASAQQQEQSQQQQQPAQQQQKASVFVSPSTFPGVYTVPDYARAHAHVMRSITDLRIVAVDECFAAGDRVCFRYVAEGSHAGEDWLPPQSGCGGVDPQSLTVRADKVNPRKARWSACCTFRLSADGKIVRMTKDWDVHAMFSALGWALPVPEQSASSTSTASAPRGSAQEQSQPSQQQQTSSTGGSGGGDSGMMMMDVEGGQPQPSQQQHRQQARSTVWPVPTGDFLRGCELAAAFPSSLGQNQQQREQSGEQPMQAQGQQASAGQEAGQPSSGGNSVGGGGVAAGSGAGVGQPPQSSPPGQPAGANQEDQDMSSGKHVHHVLERHHADIAEHR